MVWGAFKGITWQVASLSSLVVGYIASHTMSSQFAPYFPGEPVVARTLAMIATYIGVSGAIFFVAWLIRATLHRLKFEAFDRHLGMLLGGAEGGFVGTVVTLFVVSLAPQTRGPIFASPSGRIVSTVMAMVGPVLPSEAR
jgi:membrane protein required for colicin V production